MRPAIGGNADARHDHADDLRAQGALIARRQALHADVGVDNRAARRLYDSLGFKLYGVQPKALCVDGRYIDEAMLARDFTED